MTVERADADDADGRRDGDERPEGVRAAGLGMRAGEGWVYRHVDLVADPGEVVEVRGAAGTGRTMLLLTLAGRARPTAGRLRVLGHDLPRRGRVVRRLSAVARIADVAVPEGQQTVRQAFRERARWEGVRPAGSDGLGYRVDETRELTGLAAGPRERVAGLVAVQRTLLAVALAALARPRLLVLDDLDAGLPAADQEVVWAALHRVAAADACLVLASTAAGDPGPGGDPGGGAGGSPDDRRSVLLHPARVAS